MRIKDYLRSEPIPEWMRNFNEDSSFNFNEVIRSNILYYAGAGVDGVPISVFNKTHAIHTYIYVDYGESEATRISELNDTSFHGYHLKCTKHLKEFELTPSGWRPHLPPYTNEELEWVSRIMRERMGKPFAIVSIFERDEGFDDSHGAELFAIIYIGGDAIATYDALFVNGNTTPKVFMLRDHGYGGNYHFFGRSSRLEKMAHDYNRLPNLIFTEQEGNVWEGYHKVDNVEPEAKMHIYQR